MFLVNKFYDCRDLCVLVELLHGNLLYLRHQSAKKKKLNKLLNTRIFPEEVIAKNGFKHF